MSDKRRILIVDDNEINRKFLSRMLDKKNFETHTLSSGKNCLEYIQKEYIEFVLLDIMMPEISGIEVLKLLRKHYKPVELPIIMVTAKSETSDVTEALMLGANDYLTKPVNKEIAIARINTHLNIVDLSRDSIKKKELETLNSMITTYNHEINNPLTIALLNLRKDFSKLDQKSVYRSIEALMRIANIVKKIDGLTGGTVETTEYAENSKMIDLK
jgi:DNA-binding response OmpR family regulator